MLFVRRHGLCVDDPSCLKETIYESKNPPKISFSTDEEDNKAQWNRANLIDDIVFIADKGRTWNQYVQVSIIRLTEEDFNTISKAIIES